MSKNLLVGFEILFIYQDRDIFFLQVAEPEETTDKFFERKKGADDKTLSNERKAAQTAIDTPLTANIKKVDMMESYLKSNFTLKNSDNPHNMKF